MLKKNIGEMCKRLSSGTFINASKISASGKYPVIGANGLRGYTDTYNFDGRCAVIGRQGAFCGNVRYFEGKAYMTEHAIVAEADNSNDSGYLSFLLGQLDLSRFQGQSAQPGLSVKTISKIPIPVPSLEKQKKIFKILHSIDEKISTNNNISAKLESLIRLIFDYWFVQFDFPNTVNLPYKSSGGKMVWNAELKRMIPENFTVIDINDTCQIVDCLHSKKPNYCFETDSCYLLGLENITSDGYIDLSKKYYISCADYAKWSTKIEVKENDFVVTNAGRAGDIGKVPHGVVCAIGRNITAIRPFSINPYYLRQFFKSAYMQEQIASNLDNGSFFSSFNVKSIKKIKLLMPDHTTYCKACGRFTRIIRQIENLQAENSRLVSLRNFLLPLLINEQVTFT